MKFVPRDLGAAAEASNPGAAGMRREVVFLLVATAALLLVSYFGVGLVVESILPRIPVARERAWFGRLTLGQKLVEPANALEIRQLAAARLALQRLISDPGVPALEYRIVLIADTAPNAFAFPGGTIGLTRGMLDLADSEVALAFVLAHELGHFAQRDHLRGIGRTVGRGLVWSVLFGDTGEWITRNAGTLLDLAHSRQQETGADRFGLERVQAVYGRTEGSERVFAWLEQHRQAPAWTRWLQTHPDPGGRIERLRGMVEKK